MDPGASSAKSFDQLAELYRQKYMDLRIYDDGYRIFCDLLQGTNARVLDAACGPGNVTQFLLNYRPDLDVLGIDLAPRMIDLAQATVPKARFLVHDLRRIRELQQSFDGIVCAFGLPYLPKDAARQFIADCGELLQPGGVLYLSTMLGDSTASGIHRHSSGAEFHITYHGESDLLETLGHQGFRVLHQVHVSSPPQATNPTTDLLIIAVKD
ncbi:MAG: class I SAM-dependent methyltransferase [Verrucomicrobiales bacterium]|nr:class I SAM-dependent methyltransferase [Verrucomicrobiales bacterium]